MTGMITAEREACKLMNIRTDLFTNKHCLRKAGGREGWEENGETEGGEEKVQKKEEE
jgi:hypothetical protein